MQSLRDFGLAVVVLVGIALFFYYQLWPFLRTQHEEVTKRLDGERQAFINTINEQRESFLATLNQQRREHLSILKEIRATIEQNASRQQKALDSLTAEIIKLGKRSS